MEKEGVFMYCPYCNSYNEDKGNFCSNCGAPLHVQQTPPPNPGYQPPQGNAYQPPQGGAYAAQQGGGPGQPPNDGPMPELTKPLTMATPVAALIVNLVFFNLIGLLLAGFSLLQFNNYESEKRRGGMALAETYKQKSKRDAIWSIVVAVLSLLLVIGLCVAFALLVFTRVSYGHVEPFQEFFVDPFLWIG